MLIQSRREPHEGERREQKLVRTYHAHLAAHGHDVCRLQLWPQDEPAPLYCDLYDKTSNTLVEAKGSIARPALRMAMVSSPTTPGWSSPHRHARSSSPSSRARADLLRFAASESVIVIWPAGNRFHTESQKAAE